MGIRFSLLIFCILAILAAFPRGLYRSGGFEAEDLIRKPSANGDFMVYLPMVLHPPDRTLSINIPYFSSEDAFRWAETAVLWFGQVTSTENYADVRIGYTADELRVYLAAFDRRLWYKKSPAPEELPEWDSASLFVHLDGSSGLAPTERSFRFDGMLNWWEPRPGYQYAYRGDGQTWQLMDIPFTTQSGWRGYPQPNDDLDDRGWVLIYFIPYSSLRLSGPPEPGSVWGLAFNLYDRDGVEGPPNPVKTWPPEMQMERPETWGKLVFGIPEYSPPSGVELGGEVVIRHRLDGVNVVDGMVGGSSICGAGLDYWTEWGNKNYAGAEQVNVQNEADISDWPCFSKFYITFPLDSLPRGKVIISAKLILHSIGNAGGGEWGDPANSLIQVFTVAEDWEENFLTWNNAPLALENVSRAWVPPIDEWPGWPGVPREWDLSYAVSKAYSASEPLRLALYSADTAYNTGRYFSSSDYGDWNELGRPTLIVEWGKP
jgi:hypothetical protein